MPQWGVNFQVQLRRVKGLFFDRAKVKGMVDDGTRKVLSKFGYFTMRDARQSIRRRKAISLPGKPPTNRSDLLKKGIFFYYDPETRTVIIGPIGNGTSNVPVALEKGGWSFNKRIRKNQLVRKRPYMAPAAERQQGKLPELWARSAR